MIFTDTTLPTGFYRVHHDDYNFSVDGYERGHIVRSEERTIDAADNRSTFILSNIMPQQTDLNQGVWADMEDWCESMCKDSTKELFIVAGGIFKSGFRVSGIIAAPDSCYKIVVILEPGQKLANVDKNTRIEAVIMPNIKGIRKDKWEKYKRTIDEIEAATGYDFLNYVRKDIQNVIESKPSIF
ncbi:MAG: DNA/RNA non-specific endonuclease [Ignavibacteria bacterium]|nr:DNA/RNA non-specific endonuclease [Ignavibacteria bacterium]